MLADSPALSAVRRRAAMVRRRLRAARAPEEGCLVCGGPRPPFTTLTFQRAPGIAPRSMAKCERCGYVQIEESGIVRYREATSMEDLPGGGGRIGTKDTPGREFRMARMGLDILGRRGVEVMVYGIGRSLDNHHIAALPRVSNVAIGDIMRVRDDAEFHDANQPARKRFPLVIASEVVEHFRSPREDFAKLFQFVARDGLLVCGTNIHDGGDLARDRYPFFPDHTSYYTPQALLEIAKLHGFAVDFRTPRVTGTKGRKRYVLFTRSPAVRERTALYFGTHTLAPSEG